MPICTALHFFGAIAMPVTNRVRLPRTTLHLILGGGGALSLCYFRVSCRYPRLNVFPAGNPRLLLQLYH